MSGELEKTQLNEQHSVQVEYAMLELENWWIENIGSSIPTRYRVEIQALVEISYAESEQYGGDDSPGEPPSSNEEDEEDESFIDDTDSSD